MKKIAAILSVLLMVLAGCNVQQKEKNQESRPIPQKPSENMLTENQFRETVNNEIGIAFDLGNEFIIDEAAGVLSLLRHSVVSMMQEDYENALEQLNKAIARAKLIEKGNTQNVIAQVGIEINQNVSDAESAAQAISLADSLMAAGEIQNARKQLAMLTNEICITRESIDIGEYLRVMNDASALLKNKKYGEALNAMQEILGKSVREQRIIPLPLLRAQRLVVETEKLLGQSQPDTAKIQQMLDAAGYEIAFAEILGYGKPGAGYESIRNVLENALEAVKNNQTDNAKKQVATLKNELKNLKNKISRYEKITV